VRAFILAIAAVLASACGPESANGDGSQSGDGSSSNDDGQDDRSDDDDATTSATVDDGLDATAADETGDVTDACVLDDPDACSDGCGLADVMQVIDDACGVTYVPMCVPGGPKPGLPASTWWAIAPSGPVFVEYGGACSAAAQPVEWTECAGVEGEPADCACFCQQGYCAGDEDRKVLDGCGLESPCAALVVEEGLGVVDHEAEQCVLESLRDRVTGMYEITTFSGFSSETIRYYVFDRNVQRVVQSSDDVLTCPVTSDWSASSTCTLESSAYFEACLAPPPEGEECVLAPDLWVTDCVDAPASCDT
jgi:hypothetical protein